MPPGRLCRHHAQAGAVPSAAFVLLGGRLFGMTSDTFINIVQLAGNKIETICSDVVKAHLRNEQRCRLEGYAVTMRKSAQ